MGLPTTAKNILHIKNTLFYSLKIQVIFCSSKAAKKISSFAKFNILNSLVSQHNRQLFKIVQRYYHQYHPSY
jgi:hypothetical protein